MNQTELLKQQITETINSHLLKPVNREIDLDKLDTDITQALATYLEALPLPSEELVTTKYGYHSDEKKYGYRLAVTDFEATIKAAVKELRDE